MPAVSLLYEPLIERDLETIPSRVAEFAAAEGDHALFEAVARFAYLAYSPSQHGKHALLAVLAAHDLRETLGDRFVDLLSECAIYAAQSRQPWSEPPITDPPVVTDHDVPLSRALDSRSRELGEQWLSARFRSDDFREEFFVSSARNLADFGHNVTVAAGVWRLAGLLGDADRYPLLRVALFEWLSRNELEGPRPSSLSLGEIMRAVSRAVISENGSLSLHLLELMDAALTASESTTDKEILVGVMGFVALQLDAFESDKARSLSRPSVEDCIYRLGRDYAGVLLAHSIRSRRSRQFPDVDFDAVCAAAALSRDTAASSEEWSFA